ncbi:MAG: DUF427 domain-containing protein [Actinomycetota bacterium]|nr:DUF427 domain-containing protein [Actinomycetota bacterium]
MGRHEIRVETSPKRVRALVGGVPVFDTTAARLVWEHPYYPSYYVPRADVSAKLQENGETMTRDGLGQGRVLDLEVDGRNVPGAAVAYDDGTVAELRDLVRPRWSAMDEWLEEDEPVYVHPRDPYKRIDILAGSRHVRVEVDGVTVAESRRPTLLFETGLPTRYYLPMADVRTDLLRPTDSATRCPYKGDAVWWSLDVGGTVYDDLVWMYRLPTPESQKVAGLMAFYDERVDVYVDGALQPRPDSPFA